ncbi:DUF1266 domain-containing protein [Flavobacterium sp. HSC-61S13]|uniref:DUF1266 domain-containing protein n=1 Tax=Flavobacterium sp. HSC-61S13 TaxID=2910963 RepID=UPI0020A1CEDE|nr:DUF1266 domain-containing protein [Flavobacterium sp. HSC-61S13]
MSVFFKIINAFRSIRLNTKKGLQGMPLNYVLVSSMYAEQQSAYINSFETGLRKSILKKLLEDYWHIGDKNAAVETLLDLQNRNDDTYINVVYGAWAVKDDYVDFLKSNLPEEEDAFKYYIGIYRKLKNVVPELIELGVIKEFSDLKTIKDSGWNYGRAAFLARCCFEMGYISEVEMQQYLENGYLGLKKYCKTWEEYTISYILGRAIWSGANISGMVQIAEHLLQNEKSPLKRRAYI